MPTRNLTASFINNVKPSQAGLVEYWDEQQKGLCLRVSPKGLKTWAYRFRSPVLKKQRRASLGTTETVSLSSARNRAARYRGMIADGLDPIVEQEKAINSEAARIEGERAALETEAKRKSLQEVGEFYYRECDAGRQTPNAKRSKRASTLRVERPYFDKMIVPALGEEKIQDLTRHQLEEFINDLIDNKSPSAGRHCRVILHSIFEFAIWKEFTDKNPCKFLSKPPITSRERVLTEGELKDVWATFTLPIDAPGLSVSPSLAYAIKILAITLQRRGEVSGMHLNELDFENRIWNIPSSRTKNGRAQVVPLSDLAIEYIQAAIAIRTMESGFVFPSPRATPENDKPIDGQAITHAFTRARNLLRWSDVRIHDLRRTGGTSLTSERLGFPRFIVSKVLNQVSDTGGAAVVTAVYDRNDYLSEKRRALDAWTIRLLEVIEGQQTEGTAITSVD